MSNPILKNEITMIWSDNKNLDQQYANAQYALHIFVAKGLTIGDLCEQIRNKPAKFYHQDLMRFIVALRVNDDDLGLEVSNQKLKLTCPIDQRRLKNPIRATTCQHLQCFDLKNYIGMKKIIIFFLFT